MPLPIFKNFDIAKVMAVTFAIFLQIQVTIFANGDYMGLRISAADLLIPFASAVILLSLALRETALPQWKKPFAWWALILPTAVIILSMALGYHLQGTLNPWAFVNKFCGWFVLMAYFGTGAWMTANYPGVRKVFLKTFLVLTIITFCGEFIVQIFNIFDIQITPRVRSETISGFMANRNAFAFLMCISAIMVTVYNFKNADKPKPGKTIYLFWFLFPSMVIFNSSRALWILIPFIFSALLILDWKKFIKIILPCMLIGSVLFWIIFPEKHKNYFINMPYSTMTNLVSYAQDPQDPVALGYASENGNQERMNIIKNSLSMVKQYPIFGAGLGSARHFQEEAGIKDINVIDSTPFWIAAETGIIGLGAFIACYFVIALTLWRDIGSLRNPKNIFSLIALLVLIFFGMFSLFHEILYTRSLWFILGLALAIPKTHRDEQAP